MSGAADSIRRFRLSLAVDRWFGESATLFGVGHGLFLGLLAGAAPDVAARLHDQSERKAFALGPLTVTPYAQSIGRAELIIAVWDGELGLLVEDALAKTLDRPIDLAGHPACVLDATLVETTNPAAILSKTEGRAGVVGVRFSSPTFFSFGRGAAGRQRYGRLPTPGHVVASWLRAWIAAGGESYGLQPATTYFDDAVELRWLSNLRTVTVHGGKTALTGFLGEAGYAWTGPEASGSHLLAALASFAAFCGTGAKTGQGFGQTSASVERNDRLEVDDGVNAGRGDERGRRTHPDSHGGIGGVLSASGVVSLRRE